MARPEVGIDGTTPEGRFALGLRALRVKKQLDYQTMAKIANYAPSTLSKAASGNGLPTLAVTLAYVRACGGPERVWERRWRELYVDLERRRYLAGAKERPLDPCEPRREKRKQSDSEATDQFPPVSVTTEAGAVRGTAEALRPVGKRTLWDRLWLSVLVLVFAAALGGTSSAPVASTSRADLPHPAVPNSGVASVQPFVLWAADDSVLRLAVGESTRRVNVRNPNSASLFVVWVNAEPSRVQGDSASLPQSCYTQFVRVAQAQQVLHRVDAGQTKQVEVKFSVSPALSNKCKGQRVHIDYTGEAVQGVIVEGKQLAG